MTALSWQPPPVTNCWECPKYDGLGLCGATSPYQRMLIRFKENKDGITESCPMWQKQNNEVI